MKKYVLTTLLAIASAGMAFGQVLSGVITDEQGSPVIGATVVIKGTSTGTSSGADGKYTLTPKNLKTDILSVTFIGMQPQEIAIQGKTRIDVTMKEDGIMMEAAVVNIGYGTIQRRDLTGSVASISAGALEQIPVADVTAALAGRLAGVVISATDGAPDSDGYVRIRGGSSLNLTNEPLYIVDGFPVASIANIAMSDVASIDVLKDGSSTAIYGARASNGVVLVTTKSAKSGKFNVSVNAYYGPRKLDDGPQVMDPYEFVLAQYELATLEGKVADFQRYFGSWYDLDLYRGVGGNDWKKICLGRTGNILNYNVSVSGRTDITSYTLSYTNQKEKAIMLTSDYRRDNLAFRSSTKATKTLTLDLITRYSTTDIGGSGTNEQSGGRNSDPRMRSIMSYTPFPMKNYTTDADVSDEDLYANSGAYSPTEYIRDNDRKQFRTNVNLSGALTWEIIPKLKLRSDIGLERNWYENERFFGVTTYHSRINSTYPNTPSADMIETESKRIRNANTLNYDFSNLIGDKCHRLDLLVGEETLSTTGTESEMMVDNLPTYYNSDLAFRFMSQGIPVITDKTHLTPDNLLSFFARANYAFKDRYLFAAAVRADGSSKFGENHKWGYFPSASFGWRITEENFAKGSEWLSNLKLRLSYGATGNNNIPSGVNVRQITSNNTTKYPTGFFGSQSFLSAGRVLYNPDLKWETTISRNAGLDFGFFNNRLNGSFDLYLNDTRDLLFNYPLKGDSGYNTQYRNIGGIQNKGLELTVNAVILSNKNYALNLNFNMAMNRNKVTDTGELGMLTAYSGWASTQINYDFMVTEGRPLGEFWGYVTDGRYSTDEFNWNGTGWVANTDVVSNVFYAGSSWGPGAVKFKDLDGSGSIDLDNDRTVIGNALPKATGGFTISGRLYAFDLNANFNWSYGNQIMNVNKGIYSQSYPYRYNNLTTDVDSSHRWTHIDGDGNRITDKDELNRVNANATIWSPFTGRRYLSSWMIEDGSFLRLSTLTLGYTLPQRWLYKLHVRSLRVYVTGTNLFCLTDYSGFDPEVNSRGSNALTPGVDFAAYPKTRGVIFGINLNF